MKLVSVSLGLSAIAMATALTACDRNRPANSLKWDKPVGSKTLQNRCLSPFKLNLAELQSLRANKLKESSNAAVVVTKSSDASDENSRLEQTVIKASDAVIAEEMRIAVSLDCENLTAMVQFPGDVRKESVANIVNIDTDTIVLRRLTEESSEAPVRFDRVETITIKVSGIDEGVQMNNLAAEDGINKIRLEIQDVLVPIVDVNSEEGVQTASLPVPVTTIITSESVPAISNTVVHDVLVEDIASELERIDPEKFSQDTDARVQEQLKGVAINLDGKTDTEIADILKSASNSKVIGKSGEVIVNKSNVVGLGMLDIKGILESTIIPD